MRREAVLDNVDMRVRFGVLLAMAVIVFVLNSEAALAAGLAFMAVWLILLGYIRQAVKFCIMYAVLWGLLLVSRDLRFLGNLPLLTVYVRRILLPAMAAIPISKAPTGVLVAALHKMKMPKAAVISIAIIFRFLPTIGKEYRMIRDSQKFRGIGASAGAVMRHPIKTMEYILVPLLIRTSRIADELSASAMVRGMRLGGKVTSYYTIKMRRTDWICSIVWITAGVLILLTDKQLGG